MKHVIIIETPDGADVPTGQLKVALMESTEKVLGNKIPCFLISRFNVTSAIAAIHEIYGAPEWKG